MMVAPVRPLENVLDVGCNSGYIASFVPGNCRVYGVDVSEQLVAIAKKRLVEAHNAPAEALPFPDKAMDVVILGEIIEHVHDAALVLREAARVARRLVVGSTPHEAGKWGPKGPRAPETHRFHVRCYTAVTLKAELEGAGLKDVSIRAVIGDRVPQMYVFSGSPTE
jgi:ubiquinone/menaquinone biosynthesis C-methylase UbiE